MTGLATAADLLRAVQLAEAAFPAANADPAAYRLIRAERVLGDSPQGTRWQLAFKQARLVEPEPSGIVGVGGELFYTVDLEQNRATLTGYGE